MILWRSDAAHMPFFENKEDFIKSISIIYLYDKNMFQYNATLFIRRNMFLRGMVRNDNFGVDFGIWKKIDPSMLYIPLDLHSGNTARRLGLLTRKMNDWKAVKELTAILREFDPSDPVK